MPLNHSDTGEGYPVVLIHGFCESLEIWNDLIPDLSQNYRVIALDLPGFGKSALPRIDVTIENIAELVHSFLYNKGIKDCIMIGHSLGGYVALAYAELYPQELKGLGLFHTTAFADSEKKKANRNKTIAFIKRRGLNLFISSFVPSLFANKEHSAIELVAEIANNTSEETVLKYTAAMRDRKDRTHILQSSKLPILLIAGAHDFAVPIEQSKKLATMSKLCAFHVLKAGHMGMYESRSQSISIINEYLEVILKP